MPVYTVYHRSLIKDDKKSYIARQFTALHSSVTGAAEESVKVMFIPLDDHSFFSGGEQCNEHVRVVAQIRYGRTEEQKRSLLCGMYDIVHRAAGKKYYGPDIQTQIVEIDDTATVMTNGVLNT